MRSKFFRKIAIVGVLSMALIIPSFVHGTDVQPISAKDKNDIPASCKFDNQANKLKQKFETIGSYKIEDDTVIFDFELVSDHSEAKELKFGSGQQFEVVITNEEAEEVYRYSDDKFFTQALVFKTINPGESLKWHDEWDMTNKDGEKLTSGKYKAEIKIMAISEENDEKIDENQLVTVIDFNLMEIDHREIKQIAKQFIPDDAEFSIPKNLEQSDDILQIDLDNDGIDEIAVFYKGKSNTGILLLEQEGLGWKLKDQIIGYGNTLDDVGFYDLNGDKQEEILIGGSNNNRDNKLIVYEFDGEKYEELTRLDYAYFSVGDLEGDGTLEIASIVKTNKQKPSVKLQVYTSTDNTYEKEYETEFQYAGYPNKVAIGAASNNRQGIFVDIGVGAHSAVTEILIKENGEYKNILDYNSESNFPQTFKPYPLYSEDINNDGIIEVGIQYAPPETDHLPMAGIPWINSWYQWDGKEGLTQVMEEYSNYSEGYQFIIPNNWHGKYTIDRKRDENFGVESVSFIYLGEKDEKAELLVLHHIPKENWLDKQQEFEDNDQSYVLLGENDKNMLAVEFIKNNNLSDDNLEKYEKMLIDEESIRNRFVEIGDNAEIINDANEYELTQEGIIKPEFAEEIIKETADKVIHAIKDKDSETISDFVYPGKGVRFTPYTHVSLNSDVVFNKEEMKNFFKDKDTYLWGYYDGKGDEIRLTPSKYYEEFIYTEDFINAEKVGYNEVLSSGNMIENQFEVYENPIVVEYYFSGFNPDYAGMDWKSIRLVFEQYEDSWKLVGIINNQWTI